MPYAIDLIRDCVHGARLARRHPTFALVAIVTLGLALGANTAVFGLAHKLLYADLPVDDPSQLVVLSRTTADQSSVARFSYLFFRALESERDLFDGLLCRGGSERVTVGTDAGGEAAIGELVSGSYFDVLGVRPHLGRLLARTDDETPGAHPVVVLSYRYWQRRFGGDDRVIGRTLRLSGHPMTIVGVSPPGFDGLDPGQRVDLRVPMAMQAALRQAPTTLNNPRAAELTIVGRVRRGVTFAQVELAVSARLQQFVADTRAPSDTSRDPLVDRVTLQPASNGIGLTRRQYERSLPLLLAMCGLVLLAACFNIANLLVAMASRRAREFAVRLAVGAGHERVVRQVLAETLMLSIVGALIGALVVWPAVNLVTRLLATNAGPALDVDAGGAMVWFHLGSSAAACAILGIVPVIGIRRQIASALRSSSGDAAAARTRRISLAVQVAVSVVLLIGAALFVQTVSRLRAIDLGFEPERVLSLAISPKNAGLADRDVLPFFRTIRERVTSLPGVTSASVAVLRPLSNASWRADIEFTGCCRQEPVTVARNVVGPDYFRTLGIPFVAGRDFSQSDDAGSPKVAIVNESLQRLSGSAQSLVGATLRSAQTSFTVVGVVKDAAYSHVRETPPPVWYVPYEQYSAVKYLDLYLRTAADPADMVAPVRSALAAVDARVAAFEVRTMGAQVDDLLSAEQALASLAVVFGAATAALAALAVYGILTLIVTERRREIGLRMALGARPVAVVAAVTTDTVLTVAVGLVAGLLLAAGLGGYVSALLYGVTPLDAASQTVGAALLLAATTVAAVRPVILACAQDPAIVLRDS